MIPLKEQAYQHLQQLIMTDQLSDQTLYSETKLSKEIGISRTPFRDAVHRLAQEGYIDIIPSKGFMLHRLTHQDIRETFQVRSALECYCTMHITRESKSVSAKALFQSLDQLLEKMKSILDSTRSIEEFCKYDFQFHTEIVDYLGNKQFSSIFASFMYKMRKLAKASLAHEGRMKDTYEEHLAILEAMKIGDIDNICDITLKHMNTPQDINLEDLSSSFLD